MARSDLGVHSACTASGAREEFHTDTRWTLFIANAISLSPSVVSCSQLCLLVSACVLSSAARSDRCSVVGLLFRSSGLSSLRQRSSMSRFQCRSVHPRLIVFRLALLVPTRSFDTQTFQQLRCPAAAGFPTARPANGGGAYNARATKLVRYLPCSCRPHSSRLPILSSMPRSSS